VTAPGVRCAREGVAHAPSGTVLHHGSGHDPEGRGGKRGRGSTRERLTLTQEVVLRAEAPVGSRFKGYEDVLVQDLHLAARVMRYRRERWLTPAGETVTAARPAGIVGGFGPELRRFVLAGHIQGQVTTQRLTALLNGIGVAISKRQVVRRLSVPLHRFSTEDGEVLRAGLASARWITVDDTAARHAKRDGDTTQIGDDRFTAFRTGMSKSRLAFLSRLRAGHTDYVVNAEALAYMRARNLAVGAIDRLAAHEPCIFPDEASWRTHLHRLGRDRLEVAPDPVRIASEGALWGAIRHHGLLDGTVIVSLGPCRASGPQARARDAGTPAGRGDRAASDLVVLPRPESLLPRSHGARQGRIAGPF
jgi:hypothetical protein